VSRPPLQCSLSENAKTKPVETLGRTNMSVDIISKAWHGLESIGLRWHKRLSDVLREMGSFPSKAEHDIWMRDKGNHYEHVAVHEDDLLIASREQGQIISPLEKKHQFKLKGAGSIQFHLGCNFFCDENDALGFAPNKHIEKITDSYRRIFGFNPKPASLLLVNNDHPELDTSELLDVDDIQLYQSLIGSCNGQSRSVGLTLPQL